MTITPKKRRAQRSLFAPFDFGLLFLIMITMTLGLLILYSASNSSPLQVWHQAVHCFVCLVLILILAYVRLEKLYLVTPYLYVAGMILLLAVLVMGRIHQGAQRWLNLGIIHLQPSECMKIILPLTVAWFVHEQPRPLPFKTLAISLLLTLIPALMIARQPDLGTAVLITCSGLIVILLTGVAWPYILGALSLVSAAMPLAWHLMHGYQKTRILIFLNPERDPLGAGYHIIQSKIAIGSGGLMGKGWLQGTQDHLHFLPTHTTDFIFSVIGEEFGLVGSLAILALLLTIGYKSLRMSLSAGHSFSSLLGATLSFTFVINALINISMVLGLLPVVGVPLPFISYGGSSLLTLGVGFGIIMAIHKQRRLCN